MDFMFFKTEVNNPASIMIIPCPIENRNNIIIAKQRLLPIVANAIIPAKIGVEHGVPPRAKVIPKSTGYKNIELFLFCGIAFIIVGISKSKSPKSFNPRIRRIEDIISVKYPPKTDAKTLPVIAQIIPIMENTIEVPRIKQHSCIKIFAGFSFE